MKNLILLFLITYSSSTLAYHYWEIFYDGQSQGVQFSRTGNMAVVLGQFSSQTTNQPNPFELVVWSGFPGGNPESGAIWFMTNNAFLNSPSLIDLADVSYVVHEGGIACITVVPDPRLSAIGANGFNAYSGLTADIYQIFDGHMNFCSNDGFLTFVGEISILGTGSIFHSNTEYYAQVSGQYLGEF